MPLPSAFGRLFQLRGALAAVAFQGDPGASDLESAASFHFSHESVYGRGIELEDPPALLAEHVVMPGGSGPLVLVAVAAAEPHLVDDALFLEEAQGPVHRGEADRGILLHRTPVQLSGSQVAVRLAEQLVQEPPLSGGGRRLFATDLHCHTEYGPGGRGVKR